jgi:hypothetical protein
MACKCCITSWPRPLASSDHRRSNPSHQQTFITGSSGTPPRQTAKSIAVTCCFAPLRRRKLAVQLCVPAPRVEDAVALPYRGHGKGGIRRWNRTSFRREHSWWGLSDAPSEHSHWLEAPISEARTGAQLRQAKGYQEPGSSMPVQVPRTASQCVSDPLTCCPFAVSVSLIMWRNSLYSS